MQDTLIVSWCSMALQNKENSNTNKENSLTRAPSELYLSKKNAPINESKIVIKRNKKQTGTQMRSLPFTGKQSIPKPLVSSWVWMWQNGNKRSIKKKGKDSLVAFFGSTSAALNYLNSK